MRGGLTWIILLATVLIYILDFLSGGALTEWGAKSPAIWGGEGYRLLTATFLHADPLHLLLNMYALYLFGTLVEGLAGKIRFVLVYLLSGAVGYLASLMGQPEALAIGASASLFGLMGYTLHYRLRRLPRRFMSIDGAFVQILGINLILGFMVTRIDQTAHLGGFFGGFCLASVLGMPEPEFTPLFPGGERRPQRSRYLEATVAAALLLSFTFLAWQPARVAAWLENRWPVAATWLDRHYAKYGEPLWAENISLVWAYETDGEWAPAPEMLHPLPGRRVRLAVFWRWAPGRLSGEPVTYTVTWEVRTADNEGAPYTYVDRGIAYRPDSNRDLVYYRAGVLAQPGTWQIVVTINDRECFRRIMHIDPSPSKGV